jgi:hypothetical protein
MVEILYSKGRAVKEWKTILTAVHLSLHLFHVLKSLRLKNVSNYVFSSVYSLKMVIMGSICYLLPSAIVLDILCFLI